MHIVCLCSCPGCAHVVHNNVNAVDDCGMLEEYMCPETSLSILSYTLRKLALKPSCHSAVQCDSACVPKHCRFFVGAS